MKKAVLLPENDGILQPVEYIETVKVKEGVKCEVYKLRNDESRDLGIITVCPGFKTPLQKILQGKKTLEIWQSGKGSLLVRTINGKPKMYNFPSEKRKEAEVRIGETMQWQAGRDDELIFYEICEPPFSNGRFKNLSE